MKIRQQFELHGHPDPFTLLKVSQAFREIARGDALELIYTGTSVPEVLFKVLAGEFEVITQDRYADPERFRIVVRKTGTGSIPPPNIADDNCRCS